MNLAQPAYHSLSEAFVSLVSKLLQATLPIHVIQKRSRQPRVVSEPPQRSRRVANLPPKTINYAAASVCHQLGLDEIDQLRGNT